MRFCLWIFKFISLQNDKASDGKDGGGQAGAGQDGAGQDGVGFQVINQ